MGASDLDTTWRLTGWPSPGGAPLSKLVFERHECAVDTGQRMVAVQMRFSPDRITGSLTDFAAFYAAAGPQHPNLPGLLQSQGAYSRWRTDARASRARFDTIWTDGYQRLKNRLGAPDLSGRHSTRWWHAVWRTGPRLLTSPRAKTSPPTACTTPHTWQPSNTQRGPTFRKETGCTVSSSVATAAKDPATTAQRPRRKTAAASGQETRRHRRPANGEWGR